MYKYELEIRKFMKKKRISKKANAFLHARNPKKDSKMRLEKVEAGVHLSTFPPNLEIDGRVMWDRKKIR